MGRFIDLGRQADKFKISLINHIRPPCPPKPSQPTSNLHDESLPTSSRKAMVQWTALSAVVKIRRSSKADVSAVPSSAKVNLGTIAVTLGLHWGGCTQQRRV